MDLPEAPVQQVSSSSVSVSVSMFDGVQAGGEWRQVRGVLTVSGSTLTQISPGEGSGGQRITYDLLQTLDPCRHGNAYIHGVVLCRSTLSTHLITGVHQL